MKYDCIIVGAGPAGIFLAYELSLVAPSLKVGLFDKGNNIYDRNCPIKLGKIKKCPPGACKPACSITAGFGGAGAYSDGKFNITTEFGGWLGDYIDGDKLIDLITYVDSINLKHGATDTLTDPLTDDVRLIEQKAYGAGLKLLRSKVRHLGTEQNLMIMKDIFEYLKDKIDMHFGAKVQDVIVENKKVTGIILENGEKHEASTVAIVPGRDGSKWLSEILEKNGLKSTVNQVDIGVRCETSDVIMQDINKHLYEGKFIFNTSVGTTVRTFCSNPSGHVVVENHSGVMAANGHAYKDPKLGSHNTNFALLVSHKFDKEFDKPDEYAREICKRANDLTQGGVIVQKYGDILRGRRSTEKRIKEGFLEPTLKEAVAGDLGLVLPYNTMKSLIEMMDALNVVTPGLSSEHTLFYGVEAKFYSERPNLTENLESEIEGLYCGGDGAGVARGLAQAGACGVLIARDIKNKLCK